MSLPPIPPLRYFFAEGDTLDQMRDHARAHPIAGEGDMKLVWANEGDIYNHSAPFFRAIPAADARAEALKEAAAIADDFADKSIVDAAFWRKDGMPKTAVISEQHAKAARLVAIAIRDMIGGAE